MDLEDINLENKTINVIRKGDDAEDIIEIVRCSSCWIPYIERWLEYREEQVKIGKISKDSIAVWASKKSDRLQKSGVSNRIKIHSGGNAHMFRKKFGQEVYEETGDIFIAASALGQKNVKNTKDHYIKVNPDKLNIAIDSVKHGNR